jgi:hypothetical protein
MENPTPTINRDVIAFPETCLKVACWETFNTADAAIEVNDADDEACLLVKAWRRARLKVLLNRVEKSILDDQDFLRISRSEACLLAEMTA